MQQSAIVVSEIYILLSHDCTATTTGFNGCDFCAKVLRIDEIGRAFLLADGIGYIREKVSKIIIFSHYIKVLSCLVIASSIAVAIAWSV